MIAFKNVLGVWVFDEKFNLVDKSLFKPEEALEKLYDETDMQLIKKYNAATNLTRDQKRKILSFFESRAKDFYLPNLMITKKRVKDSIGYDNLIIQTINHVEELNKISNMLSKRLREWYSLYNPEFSNSVDDHLAFSRMILEGNEPKLKESMGADLKEDDIVSIKDIATEIVRIDELKERQISYLEKIMKKYCPNIQAVAGTLIGGKLVAMAGSLEKLTIFPSSTVQLLGAEKALFRHIKTGSRPPKFGVIMNHQLVNSVRLKDKGKVARMLANKISLAAKVDRFKGEFIGDKLAKGLEDAVKKEGKK